jgi:hypothetical protein
VTLILLETTENIQDLATVQVGIDLNKSDHVERLSWINPYVVTFNVPSKFLLSSHFSPQVVDILGLRK